MSTDTHDTAPRSTNGTRRARRLLAFAPAVLAVITLAACGNSGTSTATANPANPTPTASAGAGAGAGANASQQIPGVSGLVAAIAGKTLQVQGASTQTAVTYNTKTRFTATIAGSAADVKVGSCVTVTEPTSTAASSPTTSTPATKVTAGRVSVTAAVNGSCVRGGGFGGGFGGARPSGSPTFTPTPRASDAPGAGQGRRAGGFGGTSGKVTSVSGSSFVVASTGFGQAATTTSVTVTTSPTTTFTTTQTATSTAVATRKCVTALGTADSTGALTATSISVRPAENGACTTRARGARPNAGTNG